MKNKYRKLFRAGKKAQLPLMIKNEHKEGWDDIDIYFAIDKINQHIILVRGTIVLSSRIGYDSTDYKKVRKYAADIANLSQMIILKCDMELS